MDDIRLLIETDIEIVPKRIAPAQLGLGQRTNRLDSMGRDANGPDQAFFFLLVKNVKAAR